jgi:hypothetical protein
MFLVEGILLSNSVAAALTMTTSLARRLSVLAVSRSLFSPLACRWFVFMDNVWDGLIGLAEMTVLS